MSENKKDQAIKVIRDLFGDTSVPPEQILEDLEEVKDEIDNLIATLNGD